MLAWSLIEGSVRDLASASGVQTAALIFSKLLFALLIVLACGRSPIARGVALFVCGVSILAVVPALPDEFHIYRVAFLLSTVECALKALALVTLLSRSEGRIPWRAMARFATRS